MNQRQKNAFFSTWRNGENPAPGAPANSPDRTPILLANMPGQPDTNWAYMVTDWEGNNWRNVTMPGHQFYPGGVWNGLVDLGPYTYAVTIGTGVGPDRLANIMAGMAFFKASQMEAAARYYTNGLVSQRLGFAGSCN